MTKRTHKIIYIESATNTATLSPIDKKNADADLGDDWIWVGFMIAWQRMETYGKTTTFAAWGSKKVQVSRCHMHVQVGNQVIRDKQIIK